MAAGAWMAGLQPRGGNSNEIEVAAASSLDRLGRVGSRSARSGRQNDLLWHQNTATKRLTADMLDGVFVRARLLVGGASA